MSKKLWSFSILIVLVLSATTFVLAGGVPQTLNYQGTLTDSTGKPVTSPAKPVTFKLYTSALGGSAFWTEPQTVPVTNGQFSVVLGSNSSNTLPTAKFTGNTYVGVTVDTGAEMLPRQKLTSVAYALKAADAIPKGVIVMWSSAAGPMPVGWALCDGSTKTALDGSTIVTPNLTDKFIMGAGSAYPVGTTGGKATHTHPGVDHLHHDDHVHHMDFYTYNDTTGSDYDDTVGTDGDDKTPAGSDHRHHIQTDTWGKTGSASTGNADRDLTSGPADTIPPFYALAFIIKL